MVERASALSGQLCLGGQTEQPPKKSNQKTTKHSEPALRRAPYPVYSFLLATAMRLVQSLQLYSETHGLPHLVGKTGVG